VTLGAQVCLICLDALEPADFESGEAIVLECQCRGELALRYRTCAEKWARVKARAAGISHASGARCARNLWRWQTKGVAGCRSTRASTLRSVQHRCGGGPRSK